MNGLYSFICECWRLEYLHIPLSKKVIIYFLRYGSLFKTSFGRKPVVVSMDMEFNRFVFRQNDKLFQSWYPETAMTIFGKNSMATGCGQIHKHMRSILAPLYAPKNLKEAFVSEMERIIAESIRLWATKPSINVKEALTDVSARFQFLGT